MKKNSTLPENVSLTRDGDEYRSPGNHRLRLPFNLKLLLLTSYSASLEALHGKTGSEYLLTLN
ncbi:MAG: hypothetical protein PHQ65_07660 [Bacteroidales bacterium]|nr:hypothetical protein [Bacteroidales bacterium]MDD3665125.1 hypothetical protein [Bacteroidales bacterium]